MPVYWTGSSSSSSSSSCSSSRFIQRTLRNASNAGMTRCSVVLRTGESLMPIWSCRCSALGPEESPETGSRPSELQRRMIDIQTCCDCVVAWPADANWLTSGADDWKWQTYALSSPSSTGEHNSGGTNKLWLRAYSEHVHRCPANVAQSGADQTSTRTCVCKFLAASEDFARSKSSYLKFCRQILCSISFKHI